MELSPGHEQKMQAEERPTECVEQGRSSLSGNLGVSTFTTSTIDIRLVIQPEDGHPDGRRIRHVIALDGKPLRIGALRVKQVMELLSGLEREQAAAQFARWLAQQASDQHALARSTIVPPEPSPGGTSARATPRMATATASPPQEDLRETVQAAEAQLPQMLGETAVPRVSQPGLRPQTVASAHEDPPTKPEQLLLF